MSCFKYRIGEMVFFTRWPGGPIWCDKPREIMGTRNYTGQNEYLVEAYNGWLHEDLLVEVEPEYRDGDS